MAIVLDATTVICAALREDGREIAEAVLDRMITEGGGSAPVLWAYEWQHVLLRCERRGRITAAERSAAERAILALPVVLSDPSETREETRLARAHALTVYDAAYLDIALRGGDQLATFDLPLARAAFSAGVLAAEFHHLIS